MTNESTTPAIVRVRAEGAELHVEVRGTGPAVVLFGCPMDADAFAPLADRLASDHTVITSDPRGIKRSTVADRTCDVTPEILAADLIAILRHLEVETASVFGSSGGAVAALAFVQRHPDQVEVLVAHEPPLEQLLDDHVQLRHDTEEMVQTYLDGDLVGAWQRFFSSADIEMPDEAVEAWIGKRTDPQELADEQFFFAHTLRPSTYWQPDLTVLADQRHRIVVGVGSDSAGQVCDRTTATLAAAIDITPTPFVGDHTGFVEHPDRFAAQLRRAVEQRNTSRTENDR